MASIGGNAVVLSVKDNCSSARPRPVEASYFNTKMKKKQHITPLQARAYGIVRNAIKSGKLSRLPCKICGNKRSQAHHFDYKKPLDVIFLCPRHHVLLHHGKTSGLVCPCCDSGNIKLLKTGEQWCRRCGARFNKPAVNIITVPNISWLANVAQLSGVIESKLAPDSECEKSEIIRMVNDMMEGLSEKQRLVLHLRIWEDKTLREIGELLSVTQEYVRQIECKAMRRLRQSKAMRNLDECHN